MPRRSQRFRQVLSGALVTITISALLWIWFAPKFHPSVSGPAWIVKWKQGHDHPPSDFRSIWFPKDSNGAEIASSTNDRSVMGRAIIVTDEDREKSEWAIQHRGIGLSTSPECWQPWNPDELSRREQLAALEVEWRLQTPGHDSRVEIATGASQDGSQQIVVTLSGGGESRRYTYSLTDNASHVVNIVPVEYAYRSKMTDAGQQAHVVAVRLVEYSTKIAVSVVLISVCTILSIFARRAFGGVAPP